MPPRAVAVVVDADELAPRSARTEWITQRRTDIAGEPDRSPPLHSEL
jgi:hypothetical protein